MQPHGGVYTLELIGRPSAITMPRLCANCGGPPAGTIRIEKMIENTGDEGKRSYKFFDVAPPFCAACITVHNREVHVVTPVQRLLFLFRSPLMIPSIGGLAIMLFCLNLAMRDLVKGDANGALFMLLPVVVFGCVGLFSLIAAFRDTRHYAFVPPTSVTSAFHFTGDISAMFEPERHSYVLRNTDFANALRAANAGRTWSAQDRAQASFKRRILTIVGFTALGAVAIWGVYDEYFR